MNRLSLKILRSWVLALLIVAASLFAAVAPAGAASRPGSPEGAMNLFAKDAPLLAYYYIWFDPSSWNRAKTDYPSLGRYSSDDERIMLQHIKWAKAAGIDGFIRELEKHRRTQPQARVVDGACGPGKL